MNGITYFEYHVTLPPFRRLAVCSFPSLPIGRLEDYFVNKHTKNKTANEAKTTKNKKHQLLSYYVYRNYDEF